METGRDRHVGVTLCTTKGTFVKRSTYIVLLRSGLAPNLSALLGAALAAKLITAAGGLLNLARMPAQNIMLIGSTKKALLGMSGA
eukprot:2027123-Amphidinium_carterae.1